MYAFHEYTQSGLIRNDAISNQCFLFLNFQSFTSGRFLIFPILIVVSSFFRNKWISFPFINICITNGFIKKLSFVNSWVYFQNVVNFDDFFLRFMHSCTFKKLCRFLDWKSWPVGFLNFEDFTSHFLKNPKISLVFLIGPFLIRTDWVYLGVRSHWSCHLHRYSFKNFIQTR